MVLDDFISYYYIIISSLVHIRVGLGRVLKEILGSGSGSGTRWALTKGLKSESAILVLLRETLT